MLRFTSSRFSFFFKNQKRIPFLSQRLSYKLQQHSFFSTSKFSSQLNQKLLSGKLYEVLGYPQGTDPNALTDIQIKKQYLSMVKKYHSDGVIDPQEKVQNEEITKCIIQAYDKISTLRMQDQINKGIYDKIYNDEDQIAMKIYGKKFNDIKYELYKQGNSQKRAQFMEELQKIRKQSKYYEHVKQKQQSNSINFEQFSKQYEYPGYVKTEKINNSNDFGKFILPILGVIGVAGYFYDSQNKQKEAADRAEKNKSKLTLSQDKVKEIERKSMEVYEKKITDLIDSFVDEQPPSLKYPSKQDPQQIQQLIEFTIGPDVNFYEVSSDLLGKKDNLEKIKTLKSQEELKQQFGPQYDPFPLSKLKINSAITLSLQAERCLQNIYIKVKDVADEIEETGKYTPPKIFFRFFGYIMFDIRQKPLSLQNYRDTEYISLFDLFFDYYSPIPVKRHEYNEYLVGMKDEDMKMYGQVHINHRKIPERYIGRNDKVVVMKDQVVDLEKKNQQIWHNYYRKYMRIWTRGYSDRISTEHQP